MLALSVACAPLEQLGADVIVKAPNHGDPAPEPMAGEILVDVGPPAARLSLELVDAAHPSATVFVLHGIRASKDSVRGWGELLARAGLRVVLVDLRGHGRSTGDWLSYGVVESRDLAQALDALEARGDRVGAVGVMGFSYGAAVAIEWAGADARVAAVVAVAPFSSLRNIAREYLPVRLPSAMVNGAIDRAGREGGFDPDQASPLLAIERTRAPVLLIHGDLDVRVAPWHSHLLFLAGGDHTELIVVPGAGHFSIGDASILRERAPAWLARHLGGRRVPDALD